MKQNNIHIGELIKKVVKQNNIKDAELAKKWGRSRQNVYDLYKRNDVEVKTLLTICEIVGYDFFQHFSVNREKGGQETDVSIQLKVRSENLDQLFKWVSENGNVNISRK
jgi:DNA-binding Xre family transcriptional regulator